MSGKTDMMTVIYRDGVASVGGSTFDDELVIGDWSDDDDNEDDTETISWDEAYDAYDNLLDEVYDPLRIGDMEFDPSRVLRELDPIAYRIGFHEYCDSEGIDTDQMTGQDTR